MVGEPRGYRFRRLVGRPDPASRSGPGSGPNLGSSSDPGSGPNLGSGSDPDDPTYNIVPVVALIVRSGTMSRISLVAPRVSLTAVGIAVAIVGVGAAAGLLIVPHVGTFLGMLVGGFLLGVGAKSRPLAEGAIAAVAAKLALLAFAGVPGVGVTGAAAALGSIAPGTLALSLALSAAAGGFGVHLGDDLRDGLSTPVSEREPVERATTTPIDETSSYSSSVNEDSTTMNEDSAADSDAERELVRESTDE